MTKIYRVILTSGQAIEVSAGFFEVRGDNTLVLKGQDEAFVLCAAPGSWATIYVVPEKARLAAA